MINGKPVGDSHPTYITFEAGPTHNGLESAIKLVDEAAKAGADAVKFQLLDPSRLVSDKKLMFEYDVLLDKEQGTTEKVSEPLFDILQRRCLTQDEWRTLKEHCDMLGIAFFSTVTFYDELTFLVELGVDTIKICSGDIDFFPLIRDCARRNLCLQFDTGNATIGEVEKAVDIAMEEGCQRIIVHNCPSGYPARLESINLRIIPTLKAMFGFPVAFSDHTPGWEMDIAAVALGANLIEKTITLDRTTRSVEHLFSLEPSDMRAFVASIRDLEKALGNTRRIMSEDERKRALTVRRSVVASRNIQVGEKVNRETIEFSRPGSGIRPAMSDLIMGRSFRRNVLKGELINFDDLE